MRTTKVDTAELPSEARKVLQIFPEFQMEHFNDSGANGFVLLGRHEVLKQDVAHKCQDIADPSLMLKKPKRGVKSLKLTYLTSQWHFVNNEDLTPSVFADLEIEGSSLQIPNYGKRERMYF